MNLLIEDSWRKALNEQLSAPYFTELLSFVTYEYEHCEVYPPEKNIFRAFELTPVGKVKVVLIGQDPYHGPGQANGLCFSVNNEIKSPPSLVNIFKELKNDLGIDIPQSGDLEYWAKQGVLMLNATLTVRAKSPGSHQKKGWEQFTDAVISHLNRTNENIVYVLWGAYAQKKGLVINRDKNLVIESPHPSPFSAHKGFYGSKPFSKANAYLAKYKIDTINW